MYRPDVLRVLDQVFAEQPVVLTIGGVIREMLALVGRKPNHLYSLDAMGQTVAIGLGLALGLEENDRHAKVLVVEGDGSLLMGFSVLATVGALKARKLVVAVVDNGVYLATGGQPTAANAADFVHVALDCGWAAARDVPDDAAALREALDWARSADGPILLRIRVDTAQPKTDFFLDDPVMLAHEFETWLREPIAHP
ncbi:MAG: phosphonopyruvate decarboxylase [Chloroflexi bacterium]|nr:phosphonopyruvate decarboxylase [Chloroflexota bacterium]